MSTAEPWSEMERAKMRDYMDRVYVVFKDHVKAARGERLAKPIDKIAGGASLHRRAGAWSWVWWIRSAGCTTR